MANIVVIGSLNMDVVAVAPRIPVVGETIIGHTYFTEPGGKGANQAYAAAKLGGQVSMLGRIGDDEFGQAMRNNLKDVGCDVSGIQKLSGTSGIALIFVEDAGHNSIIVVPGANDRFLPADIQSDVHHLRSSKVVLLQLENPIETVVAAAKAARSVGAKVVLDPAPAPTNPLPAELLSLVDVITPNETEAAILAGQAPGRMNPDQAVKVAELLRSRGARTVIVKLGDQGCILLDDSRATLLPAPKVKAVDTTAAGDVFNAGFAVGISEGI